MKLEEYLNVIEKFIKDYLESTKMDCYVLGLSGGVDSTLAALLTKKAVGKDKLMCIMMPIESNPADLADAIKLIKACDLNYLIFDGTNTYRESVDEMARNGVQLDVATKANLKVRIRMTMLYAYAQMHRGLVVGTDNADERYTGYFTKYGDGAADILPIVHLLKHEVVEAAKILGAPDELAERVPTAGLFQGQTDEGEMRVSYKELDDFLLGKEISQASKERIEYLHRISEHKRIPIPTPEEFKRD
mgnify:CR=1 FL=1